MKNVVAGLLLLILQVYLIILGGSTFGKFWNPVLLFLISAAIPAYFIWIYLTANTNPSNGTNKFQRPLIHVIWSLIGLLSIAVAYEELRKVFVQYAEFEKWSDVVPQAQTLYERFTNGEFPYTAIRFSSYDLEPVYMPFHWLPVGLADPLNIDIRLVGFGFLALSVALYGWILAGKTGPVASRIIALILPSIPLWGFIKWGPTDISVTYEIVVGAYYLILAIGLFSKKIWIVTFGIILCLLSRYTIIFWLPLFAILLFYVKGFKKSLWVWGAVTVSFIFFFIIPFYTKDPDLLNRGLSYYMRATVADWQGHGDPPISWTQEAGISFAPILRALLPGSIANQVELTRIIQGFVLLLTFIASLLFYRRWHSKIDVFNYCLVWLYIFMTVYYFFAPLTYRYYLFSYLMVSSVLCGMIIISGSQKLTRTD